MTGVPGIFLQNKDKSWVGEQQMQQEQFDKTEFEEREAKKHSRRRICHWFGAYFRG